MKKLDRYFLRQALAPLIFGLLVYSSLAVISTTLPRLQWIIGTPIFDLFGWLLLQMPTALVQTLPVALVLAVILTFGRLATANELQAVQAGGISLRRSALIFVYIGISFSPSHHSAAAGKLINAANPVSWAPHTSSLRIPASY